MRSLHDVRIRPKLIALFLGVGLIPLALLAWTALSRTDAMLEGVERDVDAIVRSGEILPPASVRDVKRAALERAFSLTRDQILTFSRSPMVIDAMRDFRDAFRSYRDERGLALEDVARMRRELHRYYTNEFASEYRERAGGASPDLTRQFDPLDFDSIALQHAYVLQGSPGGTRYSRLHQRLHPSLLDYAKTFGYGDIFLVDPDSGDVVYSVAKHVDYTTSLRTGPYAKSRLGQVFRAAAVARKPDALFVEDLGPHAPSYGAPVGFVASPVLDGPELVGVAIFQLPLDRMATIMSDRSGLGEGGESYLVGPDLLVRSDSHRDPEHRSVVAAFRNPAQGRIETQAVRRALAGETGEITLESYTGTEVRSAYAPIQLEGLRWALVSEIPTAEAFAPTRQLRERGGEARDGLVLWVLALGALGALLALGVALPVANAIVRPIAEASSFAQRIARGDLTGHLELQQRDEIGTLVHAMDEMAGSLRASLGTISEQASRLGTSTDDLQTISSRMLEQMRTLKERCADAAQRSDDVRDVAQTLVAASAELSSGVEGVADRVEEMSANASNGAEEESRAAAGDEDELARTAGLLARAATGISQHAAQLCAQLEEDAGAARSVDSSATEVAEAATQIAKAAETLIELSIGLNEAVGRFRAG